MVSHILNSLVLISFVFFIVVTLKIRRNLKKTEPTPNIPPGPRKLPIVGNILHLFTSTPHQKLRNLAKIYGPLMHLQLGEIFTIVVSSPEYAQEVMKTHDLVFASRHHTLISKVISYDSKNIAFAPYGNYWRQLRKICMMELLSQKRVNSFRPIREEILTNLIKEIDSQKGSPFNLTQAVISTMYRIISRVAFGKICKVPEEFISVLKEIIKLAGGFHIGDLFPSAKWVPLVTGFGPKLHKLHQQNDQILESIVIEHKEAKSKAKEGHDTTEEDLVDVLLKFQDSTQDFRLTNNNIKAIILDMLAGGSETAATTINWAMAEMIRDPRVMKKAQFEVREIFKTKGRVDETCIHELKYVKLVVKEILRLHPPIPLLIPRECGQGCDIGGYHIPAKSRVIVNAWAIGRDPNYWSEAERFYPERFIDSSIDYKGNNFEYIPFGAGRRICPGSTFGLINVELGLAFLLYHFDWKLPNKMKVEDLDMTEEFGISVKRKDDLYLIPMASPSLVAI